MSSYPAYPTDVNARQQPSHMSRSGPYNSPQWPSSIPPSSGPMPANRHGLPTPDTGPYSERRAYPSPAAPANPYFLSSNVGLHGNADHHDYSRQPGLSPSNPNASHDYYRPQSGPSSSYPHASNDHHRPQSGPSPYPHGFNDLYRPQSGPLPCSPRASHAYRPPEQSRPSPPAPASGGSPPAQASKASGFKFGVGQRVNVLIGADTWVVGFIVGFVYLTAAVTGRGYKVELKSIEGTTETTVSEEHVKPGK